MSHYRTLAALIIALVASSGQSPVQPSALAEAAPSVAVEVLVSASPGTQTPDGDWCIGDADAITLTPQVLTLASPQIEVTEGTIVWQVCLHNQQSLPKEDCDGHGGPGRWTNTVMTFLSGPAPSSITTFQQVPVRGWRVQFQPTAGSGFGRAASDSFNLDRTCSP